MVKKKKKASQKKSKKRKVSSLKKKAKAKKGTSLKKRKVKSTSKKKKIKVPRAKIPAKLLRILESNKIRYKIIPHKVVFTAYDLAQTLKIDLKRVTKTLVLKTDKGYCLAVLPGNLKLDLNKFKKLFKFKKVSIVPEKEMVKKFKIKPGAITPFASLYKIPLYLEKKIAVLDKCLFQSGSFQESIEMRVKDFIKLENPFLGSFGKK